MQMLEVTLVDKISSQGKLQMLQKNVSLFAREAPFSSHFFVVVELVAGGVRRRF